MGSRSSNKLLNNGPNTSFNHSRQCFRCFLVWNMSYNPRPDLVTPDQPPGVEESRSGGALRQESRSHRQESRSLMQPRPVNHTYPNWEVFRTLQENNEKWFGESFQSFGHSLDNPLCVPRLLKTCLAKPFSI
jgi:hypothetical protein